jgi:RNA polymerase primary sigma factor
MDAPLKDGETFSLYDVVSEKDSPRPDKDLMHDSLQIEIERALDTLTQKEKDVIRLNFGIGNQPAMSLEEIGSIYDLTRERVRQIREKGIRRLRHASKSKILKTYLG